MPHFSTQESLPGRRLDRSRLDRLKRDVQNGDADNVWQTSSAAYGNFWVTIMGRKANSAYWLFMHVHMCLWIDCLCLLLDHIKVLCESLLVILFGVICRVARIFGSFTKIVHIWPIIAICSIPNSKEPRKAAERLSWRQTKKSVFGGSTAWISLTLLIHGCISSNSTILPTKHKIDVAVAICLHWLLCSKVQTHIGLGYLEWWWLSHPISTFREDIERTSWCLARGNSQMNLMKVRGASKDSTCKKMFWV